jgi:acetaldehyde dehydrogenase (acetylating)
MPAARVVVNTPSTHGAIGFSTALAPSMTLGCGSWGGNVTSDNISPLHLMDLKRVAFEIRPVTSATQVIRQQAIMPPQPPLQVERSAITALVDTFLSARKSAAQAEPQAPPNIIDTPPRPSAPAEPSGPASPAKAMNNGHRAVDFVCEDDVRRALEKGEKIYINAKTIITPSARDIGDAREVFAKA